MIEPFRRVGHALFFGQAWGREALEIKDRDQHFEALRSARICNSFEKFLRAQQSLEFLHSQDP